MFASIISFLLLLSSNVAKESPLEILHSFNVPKYIEGSTEEYIGVNIPIIDVDYWKDSTSKTEKLFVTTPRGRPGTPATLSTVVSGANNESLLSPYPSWTSNQATCDGIVSAYRVQTDTCNRLWVIDTGLIGSFSNNIEKICPPKIWLFDLKTDTLLDQYEVPDNILKMNALLTNIVVDIRNEECEEAFAYISDSGTFTIFVFSLAEKRFWYFHNRLLYSYPLDGAFQINRVSFDLMDGVLGLALGPEIRGDRTLYLHNLSSRRETMVQTSVLRNSELGGDSRADLQKFKASYGERSSQSGVETQWDKALYFNLIGENTLACWPLNTAYSKNNINKLYKNETLIQFVTGIKAISGYLYILSSTLQKYITHIPLNEEEINYRVIRTSINKLTNGRGCRRW